MKTGTALLASPDAVTGARRWLRQRSQEGLTSAGWWELTGKAPAGWPNSGWEEQAPTQLEKLPGRDGPFPLSSAAAWATQSPGAGSGLGEMAARSGCWEARDQGAGGCIAPTLPEPVTGSFYCFSAAFESREEKKRKGLKSTLKSRAGRSARVSQQPHPLLLLPAPASFVCRHSLGRAGDAAEQAGCIPQASVLQQGMGITVRTPQGAGNGALPLQPSQTPPAPRPSSGCCQTPPQ